MPLNKETKPNEIWIVEIFFFFSMIEKKWSSYQICVTVNINIVFEYIFIVCMYVWGVSA